MTMKSISFNQFYRCPSLSLPSFSYPPLRVAVQPCFIVMLIDRKPSSGEVKDYVQAERALHMQLLSRVWTLLHTLV